MYQVVARNPHGIRVATRVRAHAHGRARREVEGTLIFSPDSENRFTHLVLCDSKKTMRPGAIDISGKRYGYLTVIRQEESIRRGTKKAYAAWLCRCDCGEELIVKGQKLRAGNVKACGRNGHYWRNRLIDGGAAGTPEYNVWSNMRERCYSPRHRNYKNYGGRGITICERWLVFSNFLADMGPRPSLKHSIDRIDINGNYDPGNCRWATNREQQRNCRDTIYVLYGGNRRKLVELCEELGLKREVVHGRLKMGWKLYDALYVPVATYRRRERRKDGQG